MPYEVKGQCVYKKDGGAKVGCTKGDVNKYLAALHANVDESSQPTNQIDCVKMDIPFLIRVMEYAKEDAKTDMDLHSATEKMIYLSQKGKTLTMNDYSTIFENKVNENSKSLIKKLISENFK